MNNERINNEKEELHRGKEYIDIKNRDTRGGNLQSSPFKLLTNNTTEQPKRKGPGEPIL